MWMRVGGREGRDERRREGMDDPGQHAFAARGGSAGRSSVYSPPRIITVAAGVGIKKGREEADETTHGAADLGEVDSQRSLPKGELVLVVRQPRRGFVCSRSCGRHSQGAFRSWSRGCVWQARCIGRGQHEIRKGKGEDANRRPPAFDQHCCALAPDPAADPALLHKGMPRGRRLRRPRTSLAGQTAGRRHFLILYETSQAWSRGKRFAQGRHHHDDRESPGDSPQRPAPHGFL